MRPLCLFRATVAFIALSSVIGCGNSPPPTTSVSGVIKLAGKNPKVPGQLEIAFTDSVGKTSSVKVEEDGAYTAQGVSIGEAKVYFIYIKRESLDAAAAGGGKKMMKSDAKQAPPKPTVADIPNPIPLKLREPITTDLALNVELGKTNTFDYDIIPEQ